jgi:hypothetical protein
MGEAADIEVRPSVPVRTEPHPTTKISIVCCRTKLQDWPTKENLTQTGKRDLLVNYTNIKSRHDMGKIGANNNAAQALPVDYEMNLVPIAAQKLEWVMETCSNCAIGTPISTLLGRSIWRPFRARRLWLVGSQG